ncbi:MAG: SDR family oxidoreductase [Pseudomonadota bacterium]
MSFNGKIALVTGASRGLGRAMALALGRAGAEVIAAARTAGGLEELDDTLRADGGGAVLVPADLGKPGEAAKLGQAIAARWGKLDLWVHTAVQGASLAPVAHLDPKEMDRCWATNVKATQALIAALDPALRAADAGRAVFFADGAVSDKHYATYATSKLAQLALAESWAQEIAGISFVRLTVATPPPMKTALRARFHPGEDQSLLAQAEDVAVRLLDHLSTNADGRVDLR